MEYALERLIAFIIEALGNLRTRSKTVKAVVAARIDVQFGRHPRRQQTLGVLDVLVQEQVEVPHRNIGRR